VPAANAILDAVAPEVVLFSERSGTPFGEIFDVALNRGLNVIQYIPSHRDDARIFKRYTADTADEPPRALSTDGWRRVREMGLSEAMEQDLLDELRGRYQDGARSHVHGFGRVTPGDARAALAGEFGLDPRKKTALVFASGFNDPARVDSRSLFADGNQWLVETVKAACRNSGVNWLIALQPVSGSRLDAGNPGGKTDQTVTLPEAIFRLPPHVRLVPPGTAIDTCSLCDAADYALTLLDTVAIDMAAFGRTVLWAGSGSYSGLGFTRDFPTPAGYLAAVERIETLPMVTADEMLLARKYAYALVRLRPLQLVAFTPVYTSDPDTFAPLNGSPVLHVGSLGEFVQSPDMVAFAEWVADRRQLEYLALRPQV
jgi:hypothetical protein